MPNEDSVDGYKVEAANFLGFVQDQKGNTAPPQPADYVPYNKRDVYKWGWARYYRRATHPEVGKAFGKAGDPGVVVSLDKHGVKWLRRYLCQRAYHKLNPRPTDRPIYARWESLAQVLKGISWYISFYHPDAAQWARDARTGGTGNIAKSPQVTLRGGGLLKRVKKDEGSNLGAKGKKARNMLIKEYREVLEGCGTALAREARRDNGLVLATFRMCATTMWQMMCRCDTMSWHRYSSFHVEEETGQLKLLTNVAKVHEGSEDDRDQYLLGAMESLICPHISLAVYFAVFCWMLNGGAAVAPDVAAIQRYRNKVERPDDDAGNAAAGGGPAGGGDGTNGGEGEADAAVDGDASESEPDNDEMESDSDDEDEMEAQVSGGRKKRTWGGALAYSANLATCERERVRATWFNALLKKVVRRRLLRRAWKGLVTHALRKGSRTYARNNGDPPHSTDRRGGWKLQQRSGSSVGERVYTAPILPGPDAKTAALLCGPRGPCQYKIVNTMLDDGFLLSVFPTMSLLLDDDVVLLLMRALLWLVFEAPFDVREPRLEHHGPIVRHLEQTVRHKLGLPAGTVGPLPQLVKRLVLMVSAREDSAHFRTLESNQVADTELAHTAATATPDVQLLLDRQATMAAQHAQEFEQVQKRLSEIQRALHQVAVRQRSTVSIINRGVRPRPAATLVAQLG